MISETLKSLLVTKIVFTSVISGMNFVVSGLHDVPYHFTSSHKITNFSRKNRYH